MKEYLFKYNDKYTLVELSKEDAESNPEQYIEVPEGAECAILGSEGNVYFWESNSFIGGIHANWVNMGRGYSAERYLKASEGSKLIWQRHTQPEELPFMDSLNDQYAEIEHVRQNVFKATDFGVSGLPEFKHDFVNHPKHYCDHPSGIECIEITRHHDFAIGNAIKYLWRAGLKDSDNEIQDLKKAVWYIQDKIAQLENK